MKKQLPTLERALLQLQSDFPTQWHLLVNKATQNIKAVMNAHKLECTTQGLQEAVTICLTIADCAATGLTYFAAAGLIQKMHDIEQLHTAAEVRALRIEQQQARLKTSGNFTDKDKDILNRYYTHCLAKVTAITDTAIEQITTLGKSLGIPPPAPLRVQWVPQPRRRFGQWGHGGGAVNA